MWLFYKCSIIFDLTKIYEDRTHVSPGPHKNIAWRRVGAPGAPESSVQSVPKKKQIDTFLRSRSGFDPSFQIIISICDHFFFQILLKMILMPSKKICPNHETPRLPPMISPACPWLHFFFPVPTRWAEPPDSPGNGSGTLLWAVGCGWVTWVLHVNNLKWPLPKAKKKHLESGAIQQDHLFKR